LPSRSIRGLLSMQSSTAASIARPLSAPADLYRSAISGHAPTLHRGEPSCSPCEDEREEEHGGRQQQHGRAGVAAQAARRRRERSNDDAVGAAAQPARIFCFERSSQRSFSSPANALRRSGSSLLAWLCE